MFADNARELANEALDLEGYMERLDFAITEAAKDGRYSLDYPIDNHDLRRALAVELTKRKFSADPVPSGLRISWGN